MYYVVLYAIVLLYRKKLQSKGTCYFKATFSNGYSASPKFFFWPKTMATFDGNTMRRKDCLHSDRTTGWMYLIRPSGMYYTIHEKIPFKVGSSFYHPEKRLQAIQTNHWTDLILDSTYGIFVDVRFNERTVLNFIRHQTKAEHGAGKEWFLLTKSQYRRVRKLMLDIQEEHTIGISEEELWKIRKTS